MIARFAASVYRELSRMRLLAGLPLILRTSYFDLFSLSLSLFFLCLVRPWQSGSVSGREDTKVQGEIGESLPRSEERRLKSQKQKICPALVPMWARWSSCIVTGIARLIL